MNKNKVMNEQIGGVSVYPTHWRNDNGYLLRAHLELMLCK